MSKLSEMIMAVQSNERRAVLSPLISITKSSAEVPGTYSDHYVYNLSATFGCTATMKCEDPNTSNVLRRVRAQVVDEVFGEFRQNFNEIERALFNYDNDAAYKALHAFRNRMFEV